MTEERALTLAKRWIYDIPQFPSVKSEMIQAAVSLMCAYLPDDEYAAEKFCKSFSEPIALLASLRLREECLTPNEFWRFKTPAEQEAARQKLRDLEQRLMSEVGRQTRHFNTFMAAALRSVGA